MKNKEIVFPFAIATVLLLSVFAMAEIYGKAQHGNWKNEASRAEASRIKNNYESHTFACAGADQDFKATQTAFRTDGTGVKRAHTITIRTDADITFKLNDVANDVIGLTSGEATMTWNITEVTNIYFSCGAGANLQVTLG